MTGGARTQQEQAGAPSGVVGPYLARVLEDERWLRCSVRLITGGKSNLTYVVESVAGRVVLRRPPLGQILPTAHDMAREFRVMAALRGTQVPVPHVLRLEIDHSVLGGTFYVMEHVEGFSCPTELPPGYADRAIERRLIGNALVTTLVELHAVNPIEVGLEDFGRPQGFLHRQVKRWGQQWAATRIAGLESLDRLAGQLARSVPQAARTGLVHGDYRLDNTLLHPTQPGRIAAVLDWEMSTLGDPLADLAMLLVYWGEEGDAGLRAEAFPQRPATALPGFPTRSEVLGSYADASGRDLDDLPWCLAFSYFKLAVVCAGIVARVEAHAMVGVGMDGLRERISPLVELGLESLANRGAR
jgi:aminoglycoside phosphotransferase (APT) family kinase protein